MGQSSKSRGTGSSYWKNRQSLIYYRYVDAIVRGVAANAESIIDVGSSNTSIIEEFEWASVRHTLDMHNPYSSHRVTGIKQDFLEFEPEIKYDFCICLQVLEHIPDASSFSTKLFEIARNVLISVPYQWPKGSCTHHIHDPVSTDKLESWTNRKPTHHVVVNEPLTKPPIGQRLIAYYHEVGKEFSLAQARDAFKRSTIVPNIKRTA